jgi:cytidylate kinase
MPLQEKPIVAIDGPAGAGKSTLARMLAKRLGYVYIDTGAMYRAVALAAARAGLSTEDEEAIGDLAEKLDLRFEADGDVNRLFLAGVDVSEAIRTPEMSRGSSEVSRWPRVRAAMVAQQRRLGDGGGVVMEGRDIGTVVFPQSRAKFFVTASPEERARRRTEELKAKGTEADYEQVLTEVQDRDRRDSEREHSPLRMAEDAEEVLTDGLSIDEVLSLLEQKVHAREASVP